MRRALAAFAAVLAALGLAALLALRAPRVQDALARRVAARLVAAAPDWLFARGALRVVLCGTAAPLPHPTRAHACAAVFAGGRFYVVDTGPGSWNRLALWRVPGERIGAVLLTHFHSDHIGDLGELNMQTWVAGRPGPLRVFGPPGVERVVAAFQAAYADDTRFRIAHHGADLLPPGAEAMEARPVPDLVEVARGADVLVHEALADHLVAILRDAAAGAGRTRVARLLGDIPAYHTTPAEAGRLASQAGVKLLVLTHLAPPPPNRLVARMFVRGLPEAGPPAWLLGDDGTWVELPTASTEVRSGRLD